VARVVDSGGPRCAVDALPLETRRPEFDISWRAFGPAGELDTYTLMVSVDNRPFTPFLESTRELGSTFRGEFGHSYGFLCIAMDAACCARK